MPGPLHTILPDIQYTQGLNALALIFKQAGTISMVSTCIITTPMTMRVLFMQGKEFTNWAYVFVDRSLSTPYPTLSS